MQVGPIYYYNYYIYVWFTLFLRYLCVSCTVANDFKTFRIKQSIYLMPQLLKNFNLHVCQKVEHAPVILHIPNGIHDT